MSIQKILMLAAAALLLAAQAAAQSIDEQHDADVERRMHDAERRMAEAARQMAEMTAERLPQLAGAQHRLQFIGDDRPRLGVSIGKDAKGPVNGVSILAVTPGSAADDAGLRAGDVITAINNEKLSAADADTATERLLDFMSAVETGDTLQLEYEREGKTGKVEVEPKPIEPQVFAFSTDGRGLHVPAMPHVQVGRGMIDSPNSFVFQWHSNGWGDMELVELNAGLGKYFGTDQGLLVVNAPEAGSLQLEDGDVIQKIDGRQPTSVRHALRILGSYQSGESLQIEIMRDKKRRTLSIEMPDDLTSRIPPVFAPAAQPAGAPAAPRPKMPTERT